MEKRLEFVNEFSQRRRFNDLMKSLDEESRAAVTTDTGFIDNVVAERNYLTHYPFGATPSDVSDRPLLRDPAAQAFLTLLLRAEVGCRGQRLPLVFAANVGIGP